MLDLAYLAPQSFLFLIFFTGYGPLAPCGGHLVVYCSRC